MFWLAWTRRRVSVYVFSMNGVCCSFMNGSMSRIQYEMMWTLLKVCQQQKYVKKTRRKPRCFGLAVLLSLLGFDVLLRWTRAQEEGEILWLWCYVMNYEHERSLLWWCSLGVWNKLLSIRVPRLSSHYNLCLLHACAVVTTTSSYTDCRVIRLWSRVLSIVLAHFWSL